MKYNEYNLPDDPEIRWALETGYPSWGQPKPICCEKCDEVLYDEDEDIDEPMYKDEHHDCLCADCLLKLHEVW